MYHWLCRTSRFWLRSVPHSGVSGCALTSMNAGATVGRSANRRQHKQRRQGTGSTMMRAAQVGRVLEAYRALTHQVQHNVATERTCEYRFLLG